MIPYHIHMYEWSHITHGLVSFYMNDHTWMITYHTWMITYHILFGLRTDHISQMVWSLSIWMITYHMNDHISHKNDHISHIVWSLSIWMITYEWSHITYGMVSFYMNDHITTHHTHFYFSFFSLIDRWDNKQCPPFMYSFFDNWMISIDFKLILSKNFKHVRDCVCKWPKTNSQVSNPFSISF